MSRLCDYNLRLLTTSRVPGDAGVNCGVSVGTTEPFLRAWIALAFVAFGIAGIALLMLAFLATNPRALSKGSLIATVLLCCILVTPLMAVAVVITRRRFIRLERNTQWTIVVGYFVLVLTLLVASVNTR